MNQPPTVPARRERMQLVIECPHCSREHRHGAAGPNIGDGDGHRVAHCFDRQSPGYILVEEPPPAAW